MKSALALVLGLAFALPLAARVLEDEAAPRSVAIAKNDVRNQLLESGVFLDLVPRAIAGVRGTE